MFNETVPDNIPKDNIKDSIYYWLGKSKPFYINGEYRLRLLFVDTNNFSAKIEITNLKTQQKEYVEVEDVREDANDLC